MDDNSRRKRRSIYVKHDKTQQMILAVLIVVFIGIAALLASQGFFSGTERYRTIINMILERRG